MAMHIWNGSAWKAVNKDDGNVSDRGLVVWNGSAWVNAANAKVWNGSAWKGFLDNVTLNDDAVTYSTGNNVATVQWVAHAVDGYIKYTNNSGNTIDQYLWCANSDNTAQYEIRVDLQAGSFDGGSDATGTWLALSSTRTWSVTDNIGGTSATFNAQIRHAITQEVLADNLVTMDATATP